MAGRKSLAEKWITPDGLLCVEGWARDGLIDKQIAKNIGVSLSTLCEWKKKYPELSESLKRGKQPIDVEVENALLKRALGYEYTERKVKRQITGWETKEGKRVPVLGKASYVEETTKIVVPDTTAQIFWLKNRKPEKWRDKPVAQQKAEAVEDSFLKALQSTGKDIWDDIDGE